MKGMYVSLKQPCGDGERCVTAARVAAKETNQFAAQVLLLDLVSLLLCINVLIVINFPPAECMHLW